MEFELKVISILVLIILVGLFSYTCYCESYENIKPKEKISVYILNYKRPHNLELSLPILNNMKWVDELTQRKTREILSKLVKNFLFLDQKLYCMIFTEALFFT